MCGVCCGIPYFLRLFVIFVFFMIFAICEIFVIFEFFVICAFFMIFAIFAIFVIFEILIQSSNHAFTAPSAVTLSRSINPQGPYVIKLMSNHI